MKKLIRFSILMSILIAIFFGLQFIQVFPGIIRSSTFDSSLKNKPLPQGVEGRFITTSDGVEIELWRRTPQITPPGPRRVLLMFHGNAETLFSSQRLQEWLTELGFTTYAVEYRGYGRSGGWPSESGLYGDADAASAYILEKEKIQASELTLLGYSLGTGPAAYLASKSQPKVLILLAPFASIQSVLKLHPILKHVRQAINLYKFPISNFISKLQGGCLVVATGGQDRILPSSQGDEVIAAFQGSTPVKRVHSELAGHNDLFSRTKQQLTEAINGCFEGR